MRRIVLAATAAVVACTGAAMGTAAAQQQQARRTGPAVSKTDVAAWKLATAGHRTFPPLPRGGVRYPGVGIESIPAPSNAEARVSSRRAMAAVAAAGFPGVMTPEMPVAALRLVTNGVFGFKPLPGERIVQNYSKRLAWVLTYHNSKPDIRGPGASRTRDYSCDFVAIVDASSGHVLDTIQICHPKAP